MSKTKMQMQLFTVETAVLQIIWKKLQNPFILKNIVLTFGEFYSRISAKLSQELNVL